MRLHRYEQNFRYIDLTINYNCSWSPRNFLVGLEGLFSRAYKKVSETELYDSSVSQLHHRLMSHRPMVNPKTLIEASTNYSWTRTGYWQEKILFSEELLIMSEWLLLYVALCTLSQSDILCQYLDWRNDGYHFKQYCTLHVFQNIDIDVMHKHDDKHPAWLESEISISVLIHCRRFVPRRCVKADVNE